MSSEQSAEQPSEATAEVRGSWRDVELAWAREQLHVETDGPEGVWQSLQRCGFLPDGAEIAALEILAGTAPLECSPATADYRRLARREALECEIEAFAGRFFEHSPPEREAIWRALREKCGEFPGLARRLDLFAAGLEVLRPAAEGFDDDRSWVVESICSLFTAAPAAKSRVQRRLCEDFLFLQQSAVGAVRRIQHDQPELAGLTPGFLERLIDGPLSVSDVDRVSRRLRRSTWRILAWSKLIRDPWLATGLLGGTMAATMSIALQSRPHREFQNFSVAPPISESQLQELSAAVNRQAERIRAYGIAEAEPVALPGSLPMKRYRILGPGPDEFLLDANLILLGIEAEQYLRKDGVEDGND